MNEFYLQAESRLNNESLGRFDRYGEVMKQSVKEALLDFCRQDDEFAQAVVQGGSFKVCEFSDAAPPTEGNFTIATNQLSRYHNGDIRPVPATAVFITVSDEGVVLRDSWEETAKTQHWRA